MLAVVDVVTLCPVCAAIDAFVASTACCAARFGALRSMPVVVIGAACAGDVIGAAFTACACALAGGGADGSSLLVIELPVTSL